MDFNTDSVIALYAEYLATEYAKKNQQFITPRHVTHNSSMTSGYNVAWYNIIDNGQVVGNEWREEWDSIVKENAGDICNLVNQALGYDG